MSILKSIFKSFGTKEDAPNIKFGRFSDSYKEEEKYESWDKAIKLYEENKYLDSVELFLNYLLDNDQENLTYTRDGDVISFELYQGSKLITGTANKEKFKAEAKIAKAVDLNIGFLRRLVEFNFGLKYTRYALDPESNITVVFDTYMLDGSPYKLYYALKELAINADKQDDILVGEFEVLKAINTGHIKNVEDSEKEIKYDYLKKEMSEVFEYINSTKLNFEKYPGAMSYLLLDLVYRLDYLLKPEGKTMESFEKTHKLFFIKDGSSPQKKNAEILKELKETNKRTKEEFFNELYRIKSTFGITAPSSHDRLTGFIESELRNMKWYEDNGYSRVAESIPGFIVGNCLFNYALPSVDKEFLHLFYCIMYQGFFNNLGWDYEYITKDSLNKSAILTAIDNIVSSAKHQHPLLKYNKKTLDFNSKLSFSKSYLGMLREINLETAKNK